MIELHVVPADRHVERLARDGKQAETRSALRARLSAALLPTVAFADRRAARLALGMAIAERTSGARQMDLFAADAAAAGADDDPLLAAVRGRGGASWARLVAALDDAITMLRHRGATAVHLRKVAERAAGVTAARARTIAVAMEALDERLARVGTVDGRLVGARLVDAIAAAPVGQVVAAAGAPRLRARWLLAWEPAELAWWRALDEKLTPSGGWARVALPSFDRPLEGGRERDPLEIVAEDVARALDAAPETEPIPAVMGDLTGAPLGPAAAEVAVARVTMVRAADAVAQAHAAVAAVAAALDRGAAVERVAVALPVLEERTLGPLRRAMDDAGIITHEQRGASASGAPVIASAFLAFDAAATLERTAVAQLLRSGYVDPTRFAEVETREGDRALSRLARSLESSATAAGAEAPDRILKTAAPTAEDAPILQGVVDALVRPRAARTRAEHLAATRALWAELGLGARAGRGGLATFGRDDAPRGVPRAERLAIARDARAWDVLVSTLDLYEQTARAVAATEQVVERDVFRTELLELLETGTSVPGAGRAGAVRISRLKDVAGDELDLLVVLDVNEGVLPRDEAPDALVSEALGQAVGRASRGAFSPTTQGQVRARELATLAVAAADARSVVLAFTREDPSGAPIEPSPVVDSLSRAGVLLSTAAAEPPPTARGDAAARAARERTREAFFLDPARPRSPDVGDLVGSTSSPEVTAVLSQATGGGESALAITAVERFARCPFMGYAYVVLAAREAERREELPDAREEGTLVHEALAQAFSATRELWPRRPRPAAAILERGLAAAEVVLSAAAGHAPLRAVVQLRARDAVRALLELAIEDEDWDFDLAEQAFGSTRRRDAATSWPAVDLREEGGDRLLLRGTIDRIDRGHDGSGARVVDYKRSKTTVRDASASLGETALQVPLYASVVSRRLGLPTTGTYLPTQPRDIAASARPNAKLGQAIAALVDRADAGLAPIERRALDLITTIRRGLLAPLPADEAECRTCAVSGGCRKPRFAMSPLEDTDEPA